MSNAEVPAPTGVHHPLDLNATIVGNVVELRYQSHTEAMRQLRILREMPHQHAAVRRALSALVEFCGRVDENGFDPFEAQPLMDAALAALGKIDGGAS